MQETAPARLTDRIELPNGSWIDFEGPNRIVIGIGRGRTAIALDAESAQALVAAINIHMGR